MFDLYDKATNKDNADKAKYITSIDQKEMKGKVMNEICSYDLMDNEKYQRIEYLLSVMKETFGFDNIELEDPDVELAKKKHGDDSHRDHQKVKEERPGSASDFGIFSRTGGATLGNKTNLI